MHEMSMVQDVVGIVLKHALGNDVQQVDSVFLKVGEIRDVVDEWMQRFFDYLAKGTVAEGAKLVIDRVPVRFSCGCGHLFPIEMRERQDIVCPRCGGRNVTMISGREFIVEGISVAQ